MTGLSTDAVKTELRLVTALRQALDAFPQESQDDVCLSSAEKLQCLNTAQDVIKNVYRECPGSLISEKISENLSLDASEELLFAGFSKKRKGNQGNPSDKKFDLARPHFRMTGKLHTYNLSERLVQFLVRGFRVNGGEFEDSYNANEKHENIFLKMFFTYCCKNSSIQFPLLQRYLQIILC